ncbi:uncharacterized protein LOC135843673 isoform X2 [Planococcus citri]|uniref:uncharacterized protein LOC135843673 isoform X2 n=1 Tax=Planococcus citri TaxID=170843 RepID=UPI0031F8B260
MQRSTSSSFQDDQAKHDFQQGSLRQNQPPRQRQLRYDIEFGEGLNTVLRPNDFSEWGIYYNNENKFEVMAVIEKFEGFMKYHNANEYQYRWYFEQVINSEGYYRPNQSPRQRQLRYDIEFGEGLNTVLRPNHFSEWGICYNDENKIEVMAFIDKFEGFMGCHHANEYQYRWYFEHVINSKEALCWKNISSKIEDYISYRNSFVKAMCDGIQQHNAGEHSLNLEMDTSSSALQDAQGQHDFQQGSLRQNQPPRQRQLRDDIEFGKDFNDALKPKHLIEWGICYNDENKFEVVISNSEALCWKTNSSRIIVDYISYRASFVEAMWDGIHQHNAREHFLNLEMDTSSSVKLASELLRWYNILADTDLPDAFLMSTILEKLPDDLRVSSKLPELYDNKDRNKFAERLYELTRPTRNIR